jgi:predicted Zn-dependent protease with MMP-like domain
MNRSKRKRSAIAERNQRATDFHAIVDEVIDGLPSKLRRALRNLEIIVEEEPTAALLSELDHDPEEHLLGLYIGVPLAERTFGEDPYLPDQILIFRKPLERMCRSGKELREQIRITVLHELAHYFGIDEDYMQKHGLD